MEKQDCLVNNTAVGELDRVLPHAELHALTTGISEGTVTKHLLKELGNEVTLVNHVDSQSAKAWASKRGLGRMKHVLLKYMFVQDVLDKKQTTLAYVNAHSNKADLMTKCHTFEAHMEGCAMLGLKLSIHDGKTRLKQSQ